MKAIASRLRLHSESGFTLTEMVVTTAVLGLLMGGLATIFVSSQRASADATARLTSQQNVRTAFGRLEYETRCAKTAVILSSGQGVHLSFPTSWTCAHATGDVSWCVNSGALVRIVGSACTGTAMTFVTNVTSATPFACYTPTGVTSGLQQLRVILTVNSTTRNSDKTSATDYITMHNGGASACT